jgi:hypothetical protein
MPCCWFSQPPARINKGTILKKLEIFRFFCYTQAQVFYKCPEHQSQTGLENNAFDSVFPPEK